MAEQLKWPPGQQAPFAEAVHGLTVYFAHVVENWRWGTCWRFTTLINGKLVSGQWNHPPGIGPTEAKERAIEKARVVYGGGQGNLFA